MQRSIAIVAALLLALATMRRLKAGGGPYFAPPATVIDHVGPAEHEIRPALRLLPQVAPLVPRGGEIGCVRPSNGAIAPDLPNYLTAVALLPHHDVRPATARPHYLVAVRAPLNDAGYALVRSFDDGFLYRLTR